MEMNYNLEQMAKRFIKEELHKYLGVKVFAGDFGRYEFNQNWEDIPINEDNAREFIINNWDHAGEYLQNALEEFGELCGNPFRFPVTFSLSMLEDACEEIMSMTSFSKEHWNDDSIVLTQEMIDEIITDVDAYKWEGFA